MRVAVRDDRLEIDWGNGRSSPFHYLWLRDNCGCPQCRHPEAWERLFDPLTMPLDIRPVDVKDGDELILSWPDGHESTFSREWLEAHRYERSGSTSRTTGVTLWTRASIGVDLPEIDYEEVAAGPAGTLRWLRMIRDFGFSLVRGVPTIPGAVAELAGRIGHIQETNFGRIFDVRSKPDPENLAYTAHRLNPHTDVPNRRSLPGLQFLHCLEFEAEGGESILVDGYEAARRLEETRPEDHEVLTTVSVPYSFQDDDTDIVNRSPVIGTGPGGEYTEIRYHNALLAPLDIDPAMVVPFYRAYQNFGQVLRDPELELEFKMSAGDCQVFDNRRVLHARAEFDPQSGPRHFQGTYVDRDDFMSRLRVLERGGADFRRR